MSTLKKPDVDHLWNRIYFIRGERVMLDFDLANLYGVTTKRLNEQLKRNQERFPSDFAFRLTYQEVINLRSQIATSSDEHGGRRYLPWAFTEHGVAMLAGVLNSPEAIQVNVLVVREFIRMRLVQYSNEAFENRLNELETSSDSKFSMVFESIRELMNEKNYPRKRIKGLSV
jgi:hypothetical protein